jgi:deoxyribodipyrimidine photo-lyase
MNITEVAVFFFRRDLRIHDNTALNEAVRHCEDTGRKLLIVFAFDPVQVDPKKNPYHSSNAVRFMVESLLDLHDSIRGEGGHIIFFRGDSINFMETLTKDTPAIRVQAVFWNMDYTPFALRRDSTLADWCRFRGRAIDCFPSEDYTLHPIDAIKTGNGRAYKMFSPFHRKAKSMSNPLRPTTVSEGPPSKTIKALKKVSYGIVLQNPDSILNRDTLSKMADGRDTTYRQYMPSLSLSPLLRGGRGKALDILDGIVKGRYKQYRRTRDHPRNSEGTTKMSPYLKFGCVSIREMYWAVRTTYGPKHELLTQLYWKEFYANITFHYGHVLRGMLRPKHGNAPMRRSLEKKGHRSVIKWRSMRRPATKRDFERWCRGETGFPFVDAGMRELNETGYMHNRLRMVTSTFLMKDLHIDWRHGERYFATRLVDYDPASNNGGWQWSAGTGSDSQPYFRIFNPWTQAKRFDNDCLYIKKWVPELLDIPNKDVIQWNKSYRKYLSNARGKAHNKDKKTQLVDDTNEGAPDIPYFEPIVDHAKVVSITKTVVYDI